MWKTSVANLDHGWMGISCPSDLFEGCLHLDWEYLRHNGQFNMSFSNCLLSPSQYTVSFTCSLHLVRPRFPSGISLSIASCFLLGMTILVPFRIKPSSMVSSSLKVQKGWISLGTSFILLGQPWLMVYFKIASVSSTCIASLSCCKLSS